MRGRFALEVKKGPYWFHGQVYQAGFDAQRPASWNRVPHSGSSRAAGNA